MGRLPLFYQELPRAVMSQDTELKENALQILFHRFFWHDVPPSEQLGLCVYRLYSAFYKGARTGIVKNLTSRLHKTLQSLKNLGKKK